MNAKIKNPDYNYQHFEPNLYDFKNFKGPKAGEKYIDFEAQTLNGKIVSLSNFMDKPIVLDTGSITCPMYASTKAPMNLLQEKYPNVHFLLLYVREAHPGGKTKEISSINEEISNAKSTHKLYNEKRTILVDDIDGTAHKMYGTMPNMTYVIGIDGIVKFRANWTNIDALKKVLLEIDSNKIEKKDFYEVIKPPLGIAIRTLMIGGIRALYEFIIGLPQLLRQHRKVESK